MPLTLTSEQQKALAGGLVGAGLGGTAGYFLSPRGKGRAGTTLLGALGGAGLGAGTGALLKNWDKNKDKPAPAASSGDAIGAAVGAVGGMTAGVSGKDPGPLKASEPPVSSDDAGQKIDQQIGAGAGSVAIGTGLMGAGYVPARHLASRVDAWGKNRAQDLVKQLRTGARAAGEKDLTRVLGRVDPAALRASLQNGPSLPLAGGGYSLQPVPTPAQLRTAAGQMYPQAGVRGLFGTRYPQVIGQDDVRDLAMKQLPATKLPGSQARSLMQAGEKKLLSQGRFAGNAARIGLGGGLGTLGTAGGLLAWYLARQAQQGQ